MNWRKALLAYDVLSLLSLPVTALYIVNLDDLSRWYWFVSVMFVIRCIFTAVTATYASKGTKHEPIVRHLVVLGCWIVPIWMVGATLVVGGFRP
jgi:hypothetical protein